MIVGKEEVADVLESYTICKGDMFKIIEHVPCAELDDIERFQEIIQQGIDQGKVEEFLKFRKVNKAQLAKKRKRAEKEAIEAQECKKEMEQKDQDMDALKSLIQSKQKDRLSNIINSLEEKYVNQDKKKKKTAPKVSLKKTRK
jgi:DnaJ family protein C protein 9